MNACHDVAQHLLTEASVLVVGILLAPALLSNSLQPVVSSILLLLHPCSFILQSSIAIQLPGGKP